MQGKSRIAIIAGLAGIAAIAIYGVSHAKAQADTGYHVVTSGSGSYSTTTPTGCTGVTWPTPVVSGDPQPANRIKTDSTATGQCSTTYTSSTDTSGCLVELQLGNNGTIMGIKGTGNNCKTGMSTVILGSS